MKPALPFHSIRRLRNATLHALAGLASAFRTEAAVRLEAVLLAILIPLALLSGHTDMEKLALISSLLLVVIAELTNTAIETVVDRISHEIHPLSKRAKDIGSAIVFISLLNAGLVWSVILL